MVNRGMTGLTLSETSESGPVWIDGDFNVMFGIDTRGVDPSAVSSAMFNGLWGAPSV